MDLIAITAKQVLGWIIEKERLLGLLDGTALLRVLVLAPVMMIGAAIGARGFGFAKEETVRRAALILLAALAVVMIVTNL